MAADQSISSFTWRAHPARSRPFSAVAGVLIILAVVVAVWMSFGIAWALGSAVILVIALQRFFFPSQFSIDDDGIEANYLLRHQRLQWRDVRRFLHDDHGGYLSTRARRTRLDAFIGLHIIFGDQRDEVTKRVREHMSSAAPILLAGSEAQA
jgi:hypothetical protein